MINGKEIGDTEGQWVSLGGMELSTVSGVWSQGLAAHVLGVLSSESLSRAGFILVRFFFQS